MGDPLTHISTRATSQRERVPGRTDQVENSAGGFVFEVPEMQKALRFLILGTTGGSYYASEQSLTKASASEILRLANGAETGLALVDLVRDVSVSGRAPKQNPTLFALAACAASEQESVRKAALAALPAVARTGTMLFIFARYVEQFRGWGRGLRRAIGEWYTSKPVDNVAFQAVKYRQREGWSHRDLLRLAHPSTDNPVRANLFDWIVGRDADLTDVPRIVEGFRLAQDASLAKIPHLIREYNLPWEALPDEAMNEPAVWEALLPDLGVTAMVRQLGRLSRIGLISPLSDATRLIVDRLTDDEQIQKSRIHPLAVVTGLYTYRQGHGIKGSGSWTPSQNVVDALDDAFYAAFGNVTPSNKSTLIAIDISGSMTWDYIAGSPLTPRDAAAVLAMVTVRTEPNYAVMCFSSGESRGHSRWGWEPVLKPAPISAKMRLDDVIHKINSLPAGGTDCALPFVQALESGAKVETFVTLTDSETWAGNIQPHQALEQYRQASGIDARSVVVGMVSNGFSIADPKDPLSMDVVGFDTATPELISSFSRGDF